MNRIPLFMSDIFAEISLHLARHFSLDNFSKLKLKYYFSGIGLVLPYNKK